MVPKPIEEEMRYKATGKLEGKVALITGGDSGIGRSVAIQFAKEGADICIVCLSEEDDAEMKAARIEEIGRRAIQFEGDIADRDFCEEVVQGTLDAFDRRELSAAAFRRPGGTQLSLL